MSAIKHAERNLVLLKTGARQVYYDAIRMGPDGRTIRRIDSTDRLRGRWLHEQDGIYVRYQHWFPAALMVDFVASDRAALNARQNAIANANNERTYAWPPRRPRVDLTGTGLTHPR